MRSLRGVADQGAGKLAKGRYLVAASEARSKWTDGGKLLPFRVEDRLRARGALFVTKADLADKHDVAIDQGMVTTMFLPSSAIVAQEMVNLLQRGGGPAVPVRVRVR